MMPEAVPIPQGFADLSRAEQIEYVSALWDLITAEVDECPVPEAHLAEVERRLAEYRTHPTDVTPAYQALDRVRQALQ